ncbi:MAG: inner membrane-spanning protein YciB [Pseudobdellovibrio sp.]
MNSKAKSQALALFFGGLLPVIAFTVIEEKYGTVAGLIAGIVFGLGEVLFETIKYKKVSAMTWIGNGLLFSLGGASLFLNDGLWFKLQPAIIEFGMFMFLSGSCFIKKPILKLMIEKQNPETPEFIKQSLSGITLRLSFFMLAHALLATYAAFFWSSESWALLKGLGLILSTILYMVLESLYLRLKIKRDADNNQHPH